MNSLEHFALDQIEDLGIMLVDGSSMTIQFINSTLERVTPIQRHQVLHQSVDIIEFNAVDSTHFGELLKECVETKKNLEGFVRYANNPYMNFNFKVAIHDDTYLCCTFKRTISHGKTSP